MKAVKRIICLLFPKLSMFNIGLLVKGKNMKWKNRQKRWSQGETDKNWNLGGKVLVYTCRVLFKRKSFNIVLGILILPWLQIQMKKKMLNWLSVTSIQLPQGILLSSFQGNFLMPFDAFTGFQPCISKKAGRKAKRSNILAMCLWLLFLQSQYMVGNFIWKLLIVERNGQKQVTRVQCLVYTQNIYF